MNMSIRFKLALVKEFGSKNMGCFFYIILKEGYLVEFSHHFYAGCHVKTTTLFEYYQDTV